MKIGNREYVVIGVIAAVAIIAIMHLVVFRDRARAYDAEHQTYQGLRSQLESIGTPRPWEKTYAFEFESINYGLEFYKVLEQTRIYVPKEYFAQPDDNLKKQHIWDVLHKLEELRDAEGPTRLAFLEGSPDPQAWARGWYIERNLPQQITSRGTQAGDLIRRLQDTDALINELAADSPLRTHTQEEYRSQLLALGMDLARRDFIKQHYGETVAILYTLNRMDLVERALPKEELGIATEEEYNARLHHLFRLEYPGELQTIYKQLLALEQIIALAQKHGVTQIRDVKLWDFVALQYPYPSAAAIKAAATPAPINEFGLDFDATGEPGIPPPPSAGPALEIVAAAVPIEIQMIGSNLSIMSMLYELTHNSQFFEIDSLDVVSNPNQENEIFTKLVIKTISHGPFNLSKEEIDAKVRELLVRKVEIAGKAGAKQLADAEGFDAVAVKAQLDASATPTPTEAPPPGGLPPAPAEAPPPAPVPEGAAP
ncbi:hypothetical protein HZA57_09100 [Candidatus Poribacteria bacterium]|nr:hypothetical protein [Candidatus Poribacteria bacterium]